MRRTYCEPAMNFFHGPDTLDDEQIQFDVPRTISMTDGIFNSIDGSMALES